jgi:hypothetical protein
MYCAAAMVLTPDLFALVPVTACAFYIFMAMVIDP